LIPEKYEFLLDMRSSDANDDSSGSIFILTKVMF